MKKYAILLLSGSILTLAACGNNENNSTQAQIDSAANARSAAMEADMKAKNDSLINQMAKMRADSAMKADSMSRAGAAKTGSATAHSGTKTVKETHTTKPANTRHNVPTDVNDRPGGNGDSKNNAGKTINNNTPKSVDDRPGGN